MHDSVGIATSCGVDGPGLGRGPDFPDPLRPAPRPAQHLVQWIPRLSRVYSRRSVTLATDPLASQLGLHHGIEVVDSEAPGSRFT